MSIKILFKIHLIQSGFICLIMFIKVINESVNSTFLTFPNTLCNFIR